MSLFKKQKPVSKKTKAAKNTTLDNTSNKSPYSKQNIKKKINEFGDNDAI